jgi:hypothetical protein
MLARAWRSRGGVVSAVALLIICSSLLHHQVSLFPSVAAEGLVAWISFGKVGSSTMRVVFKRRAVERGWQKFVPGRGFVGIGFHMSPGDLLICHAKSRAVRLLNGTDVGLSIAQRCSDAPDGYVVQTNYGYCDAVHRPCRYVTILREPISRLVSAYNYFCLACSEGGSQCVEGGTRARLVEANAEVPRDAQGLPLTPPQLSCPNMSLVDYASREGWGNYYVRRLSATRDASFAFNADSRMGPAELATAMERLRRPNMLVLFTEELSTIALGSLSRKGLAAITCLLPVTLTSHLTPHTALSCGRPRTPPPICMTSRAHTSLQIPGR